MTKAELTQEISNKTGIDKRTVLTIIESLMTELKESLAQGEDVYLRGFGSFIIKRRATKTARNISGAQRSSPWNTTAGMSPLIQSLNNRS